MSLSVVIEEIACLHLPVKGLLNTKPKIQIYNERIDNMRKFEFVPTLRGLNLVTIKEISSKTNSKGEYLDIHVVYDGQEYHIFNNINDNTERYVIAQLINLGNQLRLPKMNSDELLNAVKGKQAEIEVLEDGFRITPYTRLSSEEAVVL